MNLSMIVSDAAVYDWVTWAVGDIFATYGGLTGKSAVDFGSGTAKYVPFLNVLTNVKLDPSDLEQVRISPDERQNRIRAGDVLVNGTSETPEDLGLGCYVGEVAHDLYLNSFCFGLRNKRPDHVDGLFFAYALRGPAGRAALSASAQGATRYNLAKTQFRRLKLAFPPLDEQRAVAGALEDADTLISSLEKLITKKRDIKQATMQQLLTGHTRLPGFKQDWVHTQLGEIAKIKTGSRNNQDKTPWGRYPFFVRSATVERIDSYSYDSEAVLVPGEGDIGSIFHYIDGKFEVHQRVYIISDFAANADGRFIYYYMQLLFGRHAMENSVKATVDSLRLPTFRNFTLELPELHEQTEIAHVLTDMDDELALLEERLAKTRDVKVGMMQQLLTGRTRLVQVERTSV